MEKKINIAELLKGCPKGMELYSPLCGDCKFVKVHDYEAKIIVELETGATVSFLTDGRYYDYPNAECILFPKGKTTWEGFQRPFVDGDILATKNGLFIGIVKIENNIQINTYCTINALGCLTINTLYYFDRLATEEEKAKLFDAINKNGYKWNDETKTLEKLIEPKFKVGDKIKRVNDCISGIITNIADDGSCKVEYQGGGISYISLAYQYEWELVPHIKPNFKAGDKIEKCGYKFTITEVKNDYYLTKCGNKIPIDNQDDFSLVSNKFDITNLKPFDKVLIRNKDTDEWNCQFFSYYYKNSDRPYVCIGCESLNEYKQCIPYEENKHLRGTNNDCDEYYKNW